MNAQKSALARNRLLDLVDRQKVRPVYWDVREISRKKKTFLSHAFGSVSGCLLFSLSSQLAKILGLCTKEHLLTPSEFEDMPSGSSKFDEIPDARNSLCKLHWDFGMNST